MCMPCGLLYVVSPTMFFMSCPCGMMDLYHWSPYVSHRIAVLGFILTAGFELQYVSFGYIYWDVLTVSLSLVLLNNFDSYQSSYSRRESTPPLALGCSLSLISSHTTPFWLQLYLLPYQKRFIMVLPPSSDQRIPCQTYLEKDRGFQNPEGTVEGYGRVGVRVPMLLPSTNPYPWWGYWGYQGYWRGIVSRQACNLQTHVWG